MSGLRMLDACVNYGRPAVPAGRPYMDPADLLSEMDRLGIAESWCTDFRALENSPALGNRLLGEDLSRQDRLHPVWVVLPPSTRETPSPEELPGELAKAGVDMVRAEPARHGYSLAEWCSGQLWAALEAFRVPVLLDPGGAWDQLNAMLSAHPELPVVLTNAGYRCARMIYPLLERHHHLHVEMSSYLVNEGLRELAGRFGAGRLIFGTGSPAICAEEAVGTLRFCGLGEAETAAVAGGNLLGLVAEARRRLAEAGR